MSAKIFVQIPTGKHKEKTFPGRRGRLTFPTKKQRSPQRFKLAGLFLRNWRPPGPHTRRLTGKTRKRRHRHKVMLAKTFILVKKSSHEEFSCQTLRMGLTCQKLSDRSIPPLPSSPFQGENRGECANAQPLAATNKKGTASPCAIGPSPAIFPTGRKAHIGLATYAMLEIP